MAAVLVLGGTSWLGGRVAALARDAGHDVTCLARGASGAAPDGVRLVRADRSDADAYGEVSGVDWDLVVDVARTPGHVRRAVAALADRAAHWVFVSSCSVYARHDEPGADESSALLPALEADEATPEQYGEGKVACEQAVRAARGDGALVARSGLIVGRGDPSERFGYWPGRFALAADDGRPVVVPERTDRPVQWVHVDDLAAWLLRAGIEGITGTFDALGAPTSLGSVLDAAARAAGFTGERVALSDERLVAAGVEEFMGARSLPLWIADPDWAAFLDRSGLAARERGLDARPLLDSVTDAMAWERQLGLDRARTRAGLDRTDELALIDRI